jgi:hypothetical protein
MHIKKIAQDDAPKKGVGAVVAVVGGGGGVVVVVRSSSRVSSSSKYCTSTKNRSGPRKGLELVGDS